MSLTLICYDFPLLFLLPLYLSKLLNISMQYIIAMLFILWVLVYFGIFIKKLLEIITSKIDLNQKFYRQ